jgi:hypothetical protein
MIVLLIISCERDKNDNNMGAGFEIFKIDTLYHHYPNNDYSTLDLDTIPLKDTPILRYEDLIKYDTGTHKLTIGISHDSLMITMSPSNPDHNFGSMFMVTLDAEPIYCGWFVLSIWSNPCNWVYIEEPYYEFDSLEDNEVVISFRYESERWHKNPDPRLDPRIVERLTADGKIE